MKIYRIKEDQMRRKAGCIEAFHQWSLPGVDCPVCKSVWSSVALEYPSVDLSNFAEEKSVQKVRCAPLSEFLRLRQMINDAFPQLSVVKPGTEFGRLNGRARGAQLDGFVWRAWWTICLEADALNKLKESSLSLPNTVKAELTFKKNEQTVLELDLPLRGRLSNPFYDDVQIEYCHACGRDSSKMPDQIIIEKSSVPDDFDIFRVSNFSTLIVVTERFVNAVMKAEIKGAIFTELMVE